MMTSKESYRYLNLSIINQHDVSQWLAIRFAVLLVPLFFVMQVPTVSTAGIVNPTTFSAGTNPALPDFKTDTPIPGLSRRNFHDNLDFVSCCLYNPANYAQTGYFGSKVSGDYDILLKNYANHSVPSARQFGESQNAAVRDTVPRPSSVVRKSMILPGWGQVVNRQAWKVPVIYGMLAGLAYYSLLMDQNYRDYRAAFYNSHNTDGDERFGPTPSHINPNQNPDALRYSRNMYRNRRDLTLIGILLAYGLNIVDAYVFAHMKDFDVSDDLSASFYLENPFIANNFTGSYYEMSLSRSRKPAIDAAGLTLRLNIP